MSDWPIKETRSGRMTDAERYQCVLDDILRDIGKVAARLAYGTPATPAARAEAEAKLAALKAEWKRATNKVF